MQLTLEQKVLKIEALVAQEKDLALQMKSVKDARAALERNLGLENGSYNVGDYIVDVKPQVRFDAATAKRVLPADLYARICESKPSATLAKSILRGYEYEDCQKVLGSRVVIREAD